MQAQWVCQGIRAGFLHEVMEAQTEGTGQRKGGAWLREGSFREGWGWGPRRWQGASQGLQRTWEPRGSQEATVRAKRFRAINHMRQPTWGPQELGGAGWGPVRTEHWDVGAALSSTADHLAAPSGGAVSPILPRLLWKEGGARGQEPSPPAPLPARVHTPRQSHISRPPSHTLPHTPSIQGGPCNEVYY